MALQIQTTGLEQYAPGGEARIKTMLIGGPGVGKTRMSSFYPRPIYADCEGGLASVADRRVPFAKVNTSADMLDLLAFLKQENRQPWGQRKYQTVVVDTLDAFQRKVKNEWMEKENKQVFTGWEAWGYLNSKMQLLMTRLLNLDMNVIVAVHYKSRTIKDDVTGSESHEIMLQLQGETADTAFNDFDLVGWMGTYWAAVDGQKVEKRGLTFTRTADKPFLKDRLHVTPKWMEVTFAESDYTQLFAAIADRIDGLEDGEVIDEVPSEGAPGVAPVSPAQAGSGAVAPQAAAQAKLSDFDKPTLQQMARERGIDFKGNTLKGELIDAIEKHDAQPKADTEPSPVPTPEPAAVPEPTPEPTPATEPDEVTLPATPADAPSPASEPQRETGLTVESIKAKVDDRHEDTEAGVVDKGTGEIVEPTKEQAVATVEQTLGGEVIGEEKVAPPIERPAQTKPVPQGNCDDCERPLADQNPDVVKLSKIKYKAPKPNPVSTGLCEACYQARRVAA